VNPINKNIAENDMFFLQQVFFEQLLLTKSVCLLLIVEGIVSFKSTMLRTVAAFCILVITWSELDATRSGASAFAFPVLLKKAHLVPRSRVFRQSAGESSWTVADDWSSLSSDNPNNAVPDTSDIFNEDLASQAARRMESGTSAAAQVSEEDEWINEAVETVYNNGFIGEPSSFLYDTGFEESYTQKVSFEDEMGQQISMLVNCNKRPEGILVQEGRALPPLSDEEKNDVSQLVSQSNDAEYQPTEFFREAVTKMFMKHASSETSETGEQCAFLDAAGVARWMTKCIGSEKGDKVSAHDRRVLTTIGKYAPYGTGRLREQGFQNLYLSAVTESLEGNVQIAGRIQKMQLPTVDSVWRDIRNHGILSPLELERQSLADDIRAEHGSASLAETEENGKGLTNLLDECEIVEWLEDSKASSFKSFTSDHSDSNEDPGIRRKKSSHELVGLASDDKTPLRMRDGDFGKNRLSSYTSCPSQGISHSFFRLCLVFIDEESCIGCAMCVSVCPSSFLMLDSGRARTFTQRLAPDVPMAISSCPVDCMHKVSFHELKEMEVARDQGDGRSDHRHLGNRRGHTPLSVAGMDSDANHRSSWYHYLKQKCASTSIAFYPLSSLKPHDCLLTPMFFLSF
jgi:ferredoxin